MTHPVNQSTIDQSWIRAYEATRDRLARDGMYLPEEEHAYRGVGLVATVATAEAAAEKDT